MYKTQIKFQKIICLLALIAGVVVFVYSLGIMTDLYQSLYPCIMDKTDLDDTRIAGARIIYDMQPFNNQLMSVGVALIVVSLLLFITNTQVRRKYYIGNIISTVAVGITNVVASVWGLVNVFHWRTVFLTTVDFPALKKLAAGSKRYVYNDSTLCFDISLVVFGFVLVVTALLIFNLIWKFMLMKNEQDLINGVNVEEGK